VSTIYTAAGSVTSDPIGDGTQVVVVTCADFFNAANIGLAVDGFELTTDSSAFTFARRLGDTVGGRSYHWEGRQVVPNVARLIVTTFEAGWYWSVTGFILTPP
jgi:hypothetical protein